MKISIRMILLTQWILTICALSARDWLPSGYQWCQVNRDMIIDKCYALFSFL